MLQISNFPLVQRQKPLVRMVGQVESLYPGYGTYSWHFQTSFWMHHLVHYPQNLDRRRHHHHLLKPCHHHPLQCQLRRLQVPWYKRVGVEAVTHKINYKIINYKTVTLT